MIRRIAWRRAIASSSSSTGYGGCVLGSSFYIIVHSVFFLISFIEIAIRITHIQCDVMILSHAKILSRSHMLVCPMWTRINCCWWFRVLQENCNKTKRWGWYCIQYFYSPLLLLYPIMMIFYIMLSTQKPKNSNINKSNNIMHHKNKLLVSDIKKVFALITVPQNQNFHTSFRKYAVICSLCFRVRALYLFNLLGHPLLLLSKRKKKCTE